jgi:hypothetical protein
MLRRGCKCKRSVNSPKLRVDLPMTYDKSIPIPIISQSTRPDIFVVSQVVLIFFEHPKLIVDNKFVIYNQALCHAGQYAPNLRVKRVYINSNTKQIFIYQRYFCTLPVMYIFLFGHSPDILINLRQTCMVSLPVHFLAFFAALSPSIFPALHLLLTPASSSISATNSSSL